MKKEKKDKYIVSWFPIDKGCIYGKDHGRRMIQKYMQPLTLKEAKRTAKELWGGMAYTLII